MVLQIAGAIRVNARTLLADDQNEAVDAASSTRRRSVAWTAWTILLDVS